MGGKRKGGRQGGNKGKRGRTDLSEDGSEAGGATEQAVDLEIADAVAAKEAAEEAAKAGAQDADGDAKEDDAPPDPYLLADAAYIQKDTRWRNKQRTLVFASRGVTARFRHLCEDIRKMLPHHKAEPKFEKRSKLYEINEICELKSCNNVIFFEARKLKDLYMWMGRVPSGPSIKFQVLNIHTTREVRLAGNCLLGSRPLLYFDKPFSDISYLKIMKTLFTQAFGTPRNHPKSKPFHDHIMAFYWLDGKVWFRHYQISPETQADNSDPERQQLTEIGPRFVLEPIRMLAGSFCGQTLYASDAYMSPTALRVHARNMLKNPYIAKKKSAEKRMKTIIKNMAPEDPTEEAFV